MSLVLSGRFESAPAVPDGPVAAFRALPPLARVYLVTVVVAGAFLALRLRAMSMTDFGLLLSLVLLSGIVALFKVHLPLARRGSTISMACAIDFGTLLILGPDAAMVTAATSAFVQCRLGRGVPSPAYSTTFSIAALIVTVQLAGLVYLALGGTTLHAGSIDQKALAAGAVAYFLLNVLLVAMAIALISGRPISRILNEEFSWSALHYLVAVGVATVGAYLIRGAGFWLAPFVVAALYLMYRTYWTHLDRVEHAESQVQSLSDLHLATIEALALAIDAKDQTATSHIRRVQVYATGLAEALGMSPDEVQGVRIAALLHDIGKLAVPEHILSKPGPLTPEEFQKIQIHPQVGAAVIAGVPFPYPVAPLIQSHHERWDGTGYPSGLKGDEIPLGARVLAVVDYFDALLSERPYHQALSLDEAIDRIRHEAGQALDPRVVEVFVECVPRLCPEADSQESPARPAFTEGGAEGARPATGFAHEAGDTKTAFQDIALAHREIYALYEIAQSMGTSLGVADTMALISSKLSKLVPFSTCALFLYNEEDDALVCRFASGVDAELIQQLTVKNGQGLVGWVARNLRPLVNARPNADFTAAGRLAQTALQAALVSPLVFNDELIGTLALYDAAPGAFTDDHRRVLDRICEQAAAVVNNSILFEQTKRDSLTDPLTGLPNTRFMFVHLSRELARAQRHRSEVSLLVMDLDGFKEINDRYGHHVGDRALREVARVLRSTIRPYDICVRYAGDEFVVVLSGCGPEESETKRRELQNALAMVQFEARPGRLVSLQCSCGSASFPHDGESYETLLAAADKRMYEDKAHRKQAATLQIAEPTAVAKRPSVFAKISHQPAATRTH